MFAQLTRVIVLALALVPGLSWAIGLGEIHLNSALNEPLDAEIALLAATPEEISTLHASLASRETFTRYGIDRPAFLSSVTFKVGKAKDGRDALLVHSADAVPEPFVTFLVEVNWARGRLVREYTVLLDPPIYTPGESQGSAPAVSAPSGAPAESSRSGSIQRQAPPASSDASGAMRSARNNGGSSAGPDADTASAALGAAAAGAMGAGSDYEVRSGDTLTKIARQVQGANGARVDQVMMALYRANPQAFDGNINVLKRGAVLRVPAGDELAAQSAAEASSEVRRQMSAWNGAKGAGADGHLRLVTPESAPAAGGGTGDGASGSESAALKGRVRDLESQLAESHRLLDVKNTELANLQRKLGVPVTPPVPMPATPPTAPGTPSSASPGSAPPASASSPPNPAPAPSASSSLSTSAENPSNPSQSGATPVTPSANAPVATSPENPPQGVTPVPVPSPKPKTAPAPAASEESGSILDWVVDNWWLPAAIVLALLGGLGFAAWKRKQESDRVDFAALSDADVSQGRDPARSPARRDDSFLVEESGPHERPDFGPMAQAEPLTQQAPAPLKANEDTLSSEAAINLDQGDPLAEADFHMAYGLYDQAADLVRIALEREPERRDLKLKLLEIYFVWGNKDAFLQTAKELHASQDRAAPGEWEKILIMGKQICPEDPLFARSVGSGMGAGALVDLNLEGGENRVDIDLFGEPDGEHGSRSTIAHDADSTAATHESPTFAPAKNLDFVLDTPERGADESPTREMPPRDEPTVEAENPGVDLPTAAWETRGIKDRVDSIAPASDQTAELAIDDLGLDLDSLEQTGSVTTGKHALEITGHPHETPTMIAGLDDRSRRLMESAHEQAADRDLTDLERELEASFVAEMGTATANINTAVIGNEAAPTVQMPAGDSGATTRVAANEFESSLDADSTSRLKAMSPDASIDLDLDHLANAFSTGETANQPRAAEEVFSSEVFEATGSHGQIDLDVGDAALAADSATTRVQSSDAHVQTNKLQALDGELPELEPVTMSEVGTKLDLARAYMDMGDPEGARSILDEVANEGSASQKQEARRLMESLPG